ncbi:hypothetical protein [Pontibacterium sp.]|mgnify:CR=1 FL=1|uniref:hypothetical protein n=1 Tax=Pontibacterium sp. TaxID=2036026 RepID=UPI003566936D
MKAGLITALALAVSINSGCFYLVEEGNGGVAERFPIPVHQENYDERLAHCLGVYLRHLDHGVDRLYPATYSEIEHRMIQSQRLYSARYYEHSLFQLQQAERMLRLMNQEYRRQLVQLQPSCNATHGQEFCI